MFLFLDTVIKKYCIIWAYLEIHTRPDTINVYSEIQSHNLGQIPSLNHSTLRAHIEHLQVRVSLLTCHTSVRLDILQQLPRLQVRRKPEVVTKRKQLDG